MASTKTFIIIIMTNTSGGGSENHPLNIATRLEAGNRTGLAVATQAIVIPASVECVRYILLDVPNYPHVFTCTKSVTFVQSTDDRKKSFNGDGKHDKTPPVYPSTHPVQEGSKYVQVKVAFEKKKRFPLKVQVTKLLDEYDSADHHHQPSRRIQKTTFSVATKIFGCSSTSTYIVESNNNSDACCRVSMSYSLVPDRWWAQWTVRFRQNYYARVGLYFLETDMRDLNQAALLLQASGYLEKNHDGIVSKA